MFFFLKEIYKIQSLTWTLSQSWKILRTLISANSPLTPSGNLNFHRVKIISRALKLKLKSIKWIGSSCSLNCYCTHCIHNYNWVASYCYRDYSILRYTVRTFKKVNTGRNMWAFKPQLKAGKPFFHLHAGASKE